MPSLAALWALTLQILPFLAPLANRIIVDVEECGPASEAGLLAHLQVQLPPECKYKLERHRPLFFNRQLSDELTADELLTVLGEWEKAEASTVAAAHHLRARLRQLDGMKDATASEKRAYIQELFCLRQSEPAIYAPVTQALQSAAADEAFQAPAESELAGAVAVIREVIRDEAREAGTRHAIHAIHGFDGTLYGSLGNRRQEMQPRMRAAAQVIAHFHLESLRRLLFLALGNLDAFIADYQQEAKNARRALQEVQPLLVRFNVTLPELKHQITFSGGGTLRVIGAAPSRYRARARPQDGAVVASIPLQGPRPMNGNGAAAGAERVLEGGAYHFVSAGPIARIENDWKQAHNRWIQVEIHCTAPKRFRPVKSLHSEVVPSHKVAAFA